LSLLFFFVFLVCLWICVCIVYIYPHQAMHANRHMERGSQQAASFRTSVMIPQFLILRCTRTLFSVANVCRYKWSMYMSLFCIVMCYISPGSPTRAWRSGRVLWWFVGFSRSRSRDVVCTNTAKSTTWYLSITYPTAHPNLAIFVSCFFNFPSHLGQKMLALVAWVTSKELALFRKFPEVVFPSFS
jgi:hypothetical protein